MIEIIPKTPPKKSTQKGLLISISIVLLLIALAGLFILKNIAQQTKEELNNLEAAFQEIKSEEKSLEKEVLTFRKKINNFSLLLKDHLTTSKIFPILEEVAHPEIQFKTLDLRPRERKVVISGITDEFINLAEQLLILKNRDETKNVKLNKVGISQEKVEFEIEISLPPELFKF